MAMPHYCHCLQTNAQRLRVVSWASMAAQRGQNRDFGVTLKVHHTTIGGTSAPRHVISGNTTGIQI